MMRVREVFDWLHSPGFQGICTNLRMMDVIFNGKSDATEIEKEVLKDMALFNPSAISTWEEFEDEVAEREEYSAWKKEFDTKRAAMKAARKGKAA